MSFMDKPVVTLIIPTHNNGPDLKRAIVSACEQDFTSPYEVMVVLDACTDGSLDLVKELQERYPHLIYYEVENKSLPMNRIFGAKHAQGDYLMFLDGDDYVSPQIVSKMYHALVDNEADLVNCSTIYVRKKRQHKTFFRSNKLMNKYQAYNAFFSDISFRGFMHTKIFRKDLFLKIDFIDKLQLRNLMYEDVLLVFFYLLNVNKVKCIKDCLHYYNKTNTTSMTSSGYKRSIDGVCVKNLFRYHMEKIQDEKLKKVFFKHKLRARSLLFADYLLSYFPDKETKKRIKKETKHDFKLAYKKKVDVNDFIYKDLFY